MCRCVETPCVSRHMLFYMKNQYQLPQKSAHSMQMLLFLQECCELSIKIFVHVCLYIECLSIYFVVSMCSFSTFDGFKRTQLILNVVSYYCFVFGVFQHFFRSH